MECFEVYIIVTTFFVFTYAMDNGLHGPVKSSNFEGKIVNGMDVPITMYPYYALLIRYNEIHCGGSIISNRLILTAGHCLYEFKITKLIDPKTLQARLGASKWTDGTVYDACKFYPHEKYVKKMDFYDIGLILLEKPIQFGSNVQQAQLMGTKSWRQSAKRMSVVGYGLTEIEEGIPDKLKMTVMHYVTNDDCDKSQYGPHFRPRQLPPHVFCMLGKSWTGDCYGDSGGPIVWRGYVVGVVSSGRDAFCASDGMPSMYVDVSYFIKWIKNAASNLTKYKCTNPGNVRGTFQNKWHRQGTSYPAEWVSDLYDNYNV